jgi:hypothetical protein
MWVLDQGRSARCLFSLMSDVMAVLCGESASCCCAQCGQCECAAGPFGVIRGKGS